eukprot:1397161-Rhodomonas_salina.1
MLIDIDVLATYCQPARNPGRSVGPERSARRAGWRERELKLCLDSFVFEALAQLGRAVQHHGGVRARVPQGRHEQGHREGTRPEKGARAHTQTHTDTGCGVRHGRRRREGV